MVLRAFLRAGSPVALHAGTKFPFENVLLVAGIPDKKFFMPTTSLRCRQQYANLLFLTVLCFLTGCGQSHEEARRQAVEAEKSAQAAVGRGDTKAALRAAGDARKAVQRIEALVKKNPGQKELHESLGQAQTAERSARNIAELADEQRQRREKLGSLKVRAYQKSRSFVLLTLLPQMARAADHAGERDVTEMSAVERHMAEQALSISRLLGVRSAVAGDRPDWAGTAADFRRWSTNPPVEFRGFLACSWWVMGQGDFALAEFESVNVAQLPDTNAVQFYHVGRALLYATRGWDHLAADEIAAVARQSKSLEGPVDGPAVAGCFHALLAYQALEQRDFVKMDAEIAQCLRVWPDNPLTVYLTGEKLAANGEWEKAAESLEKSAAGTGNEWTAQKVAERARELRDGKGSRKAFVLDARFLLQAAAQHAIKQAGETAASRKTRELLEQVRTFGQELRQKLPLPGAPTKGEAKP